MKRFNKIFTFLVILFLYIPMIALLVASFNAGSDIAAFKGFTFSNYSELFRDSVLLPLLLNSLIVALLSSLISTVIGTAAAIGIHSMGGRLKRLCMSVTNIPLKKDDVLGFTTLLIAHITFNLPYVILSVLPKLTQMDPHLQEAALDLGCTPIQAFFKVTIYEIMPGIVSGALMAFAMSLDDFVISYFVYGPNFITLPVEIYNYTKKPLHPKIYALFTLLFLSILAVMVIMNLLQARDEKRKATLRG